MSNTEVAEIFQALEDVSPLRRSKAIEELRDSVKENHGHLLFGNVKRVFSVLKARLRDNNWNVAHQSIQFLGDLFRNQDLGPDCKSCLSIILPTLVENLGDSKIVIRKASLQVIKDLLAHADSASLVLDTFLRCGLENDEWRVRQESVQSLASVVECATAAGAIESVSVVDAIVSRLRDPSMVVVQAAEESIFALQAQLGEETVQAAVKRMGASKQQLFAEHQKNIMKNSGSNFMITPAADTLLQFGFIPINVLNQLRDTGNWKVRAAGIEELQRLVTGLTNVGPAVPHLPALMEFCAGLLSDQNFKISLTTIHILGIMVEKFGASMQSAVESILPPLIEKLADNKIVVRQGIMKFMNGLISVVNPDPVLTTLLAYCGDTNARVREEVVNIATVAMLTAVDHPFDYPSLVAPLCRGLCDSKPKVRDAAMDAMAVMHSRIGPNEMRSILTPSLVDEEMHYRLQERFAQGALPKLSAEGLVLHVSQGGGSGLTIESGDDAPRSRRTTPASRASVTPGTTPTAARKIPWELPGSRNGSRNGSRQSSAAEGAQRPGEQEDARGPWQGDIPEWDQRLAYERRVYSRDEEGQRYQYQGQQLSPQPQPRQQQQHQPPQQPQYAQPQQQPPPQYAQQYPQQQAAAAAAAAAAQQYAQPQYAQPQYAQPQYAQPQQYPQQQAPHYQQMGHFQQSEDYRVLPQPDEQDQEAWWEKGDAAPIGDLMDPPSPSNPQPRPSPLRDGSTPSSPSSPQRREAAASPQSPRAFRRDGAHVPGAVAQPTALVFSEARGGQTTDSPRKDDKVKLWLPDAAPAENSSGDDLPTGSGYGSPSADERMPTGAGYGGGGDGAAAADDLPWWEKAEQAEVGSPHRSRRRTAEERSDVGSAPVSAPSSASSSRDDGKLSLLKQNSRGRDRTKLDSGGTGPRHGRREAGSSRRAARTDSSHSDDPPSPTRTGQLGKSAIDIGTRPVELLSTEDLEPLDAPAKEVRHCLQKLKSDDWSVMYEGIDVLRRLAKHNPDMLHNTASELGTALLHLCQNLRSQVSRNALLAFGEMFMFLKQHMDPIIETAVPVLMKRACETNAFIRDSSDNVLHQMVRFASVRPSMVALMAAGTNRNAHMRTRCAAHLESLIEASGDKLLQLRETDRLFSTFAAFVGDSNPECRAHGKRAACGLAELCGSSEFERKCKALISPEANCRKVLEVAEQGRLQGVDIFGAAPGGFSGGVVGGGRTRRLTTSATASSPKRFGGKSASFRQQQQPAHTASADGTDESLQALSVQGTQGSQKPRRSVVRTRTAPAAKDIPELEGLDLRFSNMGAGDWRVRHSALTELVDIMLKYPVEVAPKLVSIFDHLTLRLADGNSKVLLLALTSLVKLVPVLKNSLEVVLNTLIPSLSQQIGSSNASVRQTTLAVLDAIIQHVDNTSLVQYFANVIAFGNPRAKAVIVEKTAAIVPQVYRQKPQLILKHVLPRAVRLVEDQNGEMRTACTALLQSLHACLGDKLEATEMTEEQRRRVVAAVGGNAQYHRSPAKGRT